MKTQTSERQESLLNQLWASIASTIAILIICCGLYPLLIWAIAGIAFPWRANGSLVTKNGQATSNESEAIGSLLLGQNFAAAKYFHPRPSAAGNGYDATNSGGSNLGPLSAKFLDSVKQRVTAYAAENNIDLTKTKIPADAVTASGSGLDPHISPANATLQADRVARARNIPSDQVQKLIEQCTEGPDLGILGEAGVNVLRLNLSLDTKGK